MSEGISNIKLKSFQSMIFKRLIANLVLSYSTIFLFVFGLAVLILRSAELAAAEHVLLGFYAWIPVLAYAIWKASTLLPGLDDLKIVIDCHNELHGQLMSDDQLSVENAFKDWSKIQLPNIEWKWETRTSLLAMAVVFILVAFLMPVMFLSSNANEKLNVSEPVAQLEEQLEVLKEEEVVEEERVEGLAEELDRIEEDAKNEDPGKTWEALDHFSEMLKKEGKVALTQAGKEMMKLAQLQNFSQALDELSNKLTPNQMEEQMADLNKMLKESRNVRQKVMKISPELAKAMKKGAVKKGQLSELMKNLNLSQKDIENMLKKMKESKLISEKECSSCMSKGKGNKKGKGGKAGKGGSGDKDVEDLKNYILSQKKGGKVSKMLMAGNIPGKGGINEGPGHAPISWDQKTDLAGKKFKAEALPQSNDSSDESDLLGITLDTPTEDADVKVTSGALGSAGAGGGQAESQTILPKHRGALQRYFNRKSEKKDNE